MRSALRSRDGLFRDGCDAGSVAKSASPSDRHASREREEPTQPSTAAGKSALEGGNRGNRREDRTARPGNKKLCRTRASANDPASPTTSPIATGRIPCANTSFRIPAAPSRPSPCEPPSPAFAGSPN